KLGEARAAIDAFRTEWGDDPALEETQRAVAAEFEREQARQAALAKLRELIDAEQFAEAARAVESALATYPGDVAIGRLRAEVEERRRVWQARQAEQAVAAEINRARDAVHDRPSEAVSILEALGLRFPGRSDVDAALKEARKAAT